MLPMLLKTGLSLAGRFFLNRQNNSTSLAAGNQQIWAAKESNIHDEQKGVQKAFAAEWAPRGNRTWFDSAVDGINRLVRPTFSFGVVGLFVFCIQSPAEFGAAMAALALMPTYGWALMLTVTGFWFGGRFLEKLGSFKPKKGKTGELEKSAAAPPAPVPDVRSGKALPVPDDWKD